MRRALEYFRTDRIKYDRLLDRTLFKMAAYKHIVIDGSLKSISLTLDLSSFKTRESHGVTDSYQEIYKKYVGDTRTR